MLNLYSVRNFFEPHNLADIQTYQMFAAAVETSRRAPNRAHANRESREADSLAGLKSLGVRYVAIDGSYQNALAVRDIGGSKVSLIDLGPITADEMSARSVEFGRAYRHSDVVSARLSGRAVIHDERIYQKIGTLVPASDFTLEYRPGGVAVQARSAGESIVLLPFQFSNCLRLSDAAGEAAELLRVNGGQAALHFVNSAAGLISNALSYFGDG